MSLDQKERLTVGSNSGAVTEYAAELLKNHRQEYLLFYRKDAELLNRETNGPTRYQMDWRYLYINLLKTRGDSEMPRLADLLSVQFLDWCLVAAEGAKDELISVPSFDAKYRLVNDRLRERLGEYIGKSCGSTLIDPRIESVDWQHPHKYQDYRFSLDTTDKQEIARFSVAHAVCDTVIACDYTFGTSEEGQLTIDNVNYYVKPVP